MLHHTAAFYDSDETLSRQVADSVIEGVTRGEDVLVRLPDAQLDLIAGHVRSGPSGPGSVSLMAAEGAYDRPVGAMSGLSSFVRQRSRSGVAVRAIGEIPMARDIDERDAWLRYEAAVNLVFADSPLTAICAYDTRRYPAGGLPGVRATHPNTGLGADLRSSAEYQEPEVAVAGLHSALVSVPRRSPDLTLTELTRSRSAREEVALLLPERKHDVRVVVSELINNAIIHGGGFASVEAWAEPAALLIRVSDDGPGFDDPFAGLRPPPESGGSAGLWIVNQLASSLAVDHGARGGARVTVALERTNR